MTSDDPEIGDFVEVRGRPWLVEGIDDKGQRLSALKLSCISDDAQGEPLEVVWDAEIGARRLIDDFWSLLGRDGTDDPPVFAAYLRTLKWHTATAADRDLLQAPSAPVSASTPISSCRCARRSGCRASTC